VADQAEGERALTPADLARYLVDLDDPRAKGARSTVTLTALIGMAREALTSPDLAESARLRAENERLTAARDRVLALCDEVHQDRIDSCGKVEDERLDVCVVRVLLAPVSTDTDKPREG
jgi:hypothetical protein